MMRLRARLAGDGEDGSIALFVLLFATALLGCLGLVVDGGHFLAARTRASDIAQECARAAARAVDTGALRADDQRTLITADGAESALTAYTRTLGTGETCTLVFPTGNQVGNHVTVKAHATQQVSLLSIVGVNHLSADETAPAEPVQGITVGATS